MLVTFLRHATAEDGSITLPDAERALVDKGEKQVKRLAFFCEANQLIPEKLYCSPLLRAQQTAKILQEQLAGCPTPETADWLGTDSSPQIIVAELGKLAEQGFADVWLVGHEPDFSETMGQLLGTSGDAIVIKKASLTRFEVDFSVTPSAALLWSIPCSLMRPK